MPYQRPSLRKDEALPNLYELDSIEQIQALSAPIRYRMLVLLTERAMTAAQLARALNISRQRAHYHLKVLERNRLASFVGTEINGEMVERYYRAYAFIHSYRSLVDRYYQTQPKREANRLMKAINEFVLTLIDEARENLLKSDYLEQFQLSYQFDSPLLLNQEQAKTLREEIIDLCHRYLEIDHQNRMQEPSQELIRLRNSIFLGPVPREFSAVLSTSDGASEQTTLKGPEA
jgi:DNA-binding transcriptional ArsR family regulator